MTMRTKLILFFVLIAIAFAVGFYINYSRIGLLQHEVQQAQNQANSMQTQLQYCQLRDLAGLTFLEAERQNYGLAGKYAKSYFNQAQELAKSSSGSTAQSFQKLLTQRDEITADLAKGDAAVVPKLETLYLQTYEVTKGKKAEPTFPAGPGGD